MYQKIDFRCLSRTFILSCIYSHIASFVIPSRCYQQRSSHDEIWIYHGIVCSRVVRIPFRETETTHGNKTHGEGKDSVYECVNKLNSNDIPTVQLQSVQAIPSQSDLIKLIAAFTF